MLLDCLRILQQKSAMVPETDMYVTEVYFPRACALYCFARFVQLVEAFFRVLPPLLWSRLTLLAPADPRSFFVLPSTSGFRLRGLCVVCFTTAAAGLPFCTFRARVTLSGRGSSGGNFFPSRRRAFSTACSSCMIISLSKMK